MTALGIGRGGRLLRYLIGCGAAGVIGAEVLTLAGPAPALGLQVAAQLGVVVDVHGPAALAVALLAARRSVVAADDEVGARAHGAGGDVVAVNDCAGAPSSICRVARGLPGWRSVQAMTFSPSSARTAASW